jgi:hypothetical protein
MTEAEGKSEEEEIVAKACAIGELRDIDGRLVAFAFTLTRAALALDIKANALTLSILTLFNASPTAELALC